MTVKTIYLKKTNGKLNGNLILFSNSRSNIKSLKRYLSNNEFVYINDLLKNLEPKKNLFIFEINSKKKIILVFINNNFKNAEIENLGAECHRYINSKKNNEYFLISDSLITQKENFLSYFLHGINLKSYEFKK